MDAGQNHLLTRKLADLARELGACADEGAAAALWAEAEAALAWADAEEDADVALPILERSLPELEALVRGWSAGTARLPDWDTAVLKRALKAYRKRLKLARLDDESSSSRNPLSRGEASGILGVQAPGQYPQEVWDLLVAQGKLRDAGDGLYELATV